MSIREIIQWVVGIIFGLFSVFTVAMPTQLTLLTTGRVGDARPVAEDFVPAIRLVAFTDSHNRNDNVAAAIDAAYLLFDGNAENKKSRRICPPETVCRMPQCC